MKKGEKFKIDQKWWSKAKDATIPSTGLGAVMAKYAELKAKAVRAAQSGKYDDDEIVAALEKAHGVLHTELPAAVNKAIKACNKTLHKDTLACLQTTATPAIKLERDFLDDCQDQFESKYATFSKPIMDRLKAIQDAVGDYKTDGHTRYKDSETTFKNLETLVKKTEAAAKKAPIKEDMLRTLTTQLSEMVSKLMDDVDTLSQVADATEEERDALASLRTQHKTELSPADTGKLSDGFSKVDVERTTILSYRDRATAFYRQAQTHAASWQKFTGAKMVESPEQVRKRLTRLSSDMDRLEERGREYNNDMLAWLHRATTMISQPEVMEKSEGRPRTEFAEIIQSWIDRSIVLAAKGKKLSEQAAKMSDLVLSKVPTSIKKLPELAEALDQMTEPVTALKAYDNVKNPKAISDLKAQKVKVAKAFPKQ